MQTVITICADILKISALPLAVMLIVLFIGDK